MPDDKDRRGPADRLRVNVNEEYEVRYWAERLGVSEERLRAAVRAVGVMVKDVEAWLKKPR